jgi:hypothetical protein
LKVALLVLLIEGRLGRGAVNRFMVGQALPSDTQQRLNCWALLIQGKVFSFTFHHANQTKTEFGMILAMLSYNNLKTNIFLTQVDIL